MPLWNSESILCSFLRSVIFVLENTLIAYIKLGSNARGYLQRNGYDH